MTDNLTVLILTNYSKRDADFMGLWSESRRSGARWKTIQWNVGRVHRTGRIFQSRMDEVHTSRAIYANQIWQVEGEL